VIVDHLRGDPDLPIVTGRVVNAFQLPNWNLPDQQALSGFVSKELNGGQKNVWVNDDTPGQVQTQLRSAHMASGLHMGYITRISEPAGRQEKRGEGAELRTDGQAAVRAAQGLLLTTFARPAANGDAFSVDEVNEQLAASFELADNLAQIAQTAGANDGEQKNVAALLKDQAVAIKGNGELAQFNDPQLVLASPAGGTISTPEQIHLSSGRATAVTAGTDLSIATGGSLLASMRQGVRLFAYKIGMRLIAAAGDIDIKALKDSINLLAKLNVTVSANKIRISAQEEVEISGGGSYTRWNAGQVTTGTTGAFLVHSDGRTFTGPDNIGKPQLPTPLELPESLNVTLGALTGEAHRYVSEPYELYKGTAKIDEGVTDEYGRVVVKDHKPGTLAYKVKLVNGGQFDLKVKDALDADSEHTEHRTNRGERLV
jgi:type VI secretion system secreted protein VgrG